jgi:putative inorganic carbon (hco3(-)) transporter
VALALLLVAAAGVVAVPGLSSRLQSLESDRLALQTAGIEMIADYPLLGVGEGNFVAVLQTGPRYQYTEYGKAQSTPHVSVLLAAAYAGVAAGLVLLFVWLVILGRGVAYSALAKDPKRRLLLAALTAACVAYLFQDQLNNLIFIPKTRTFLWIFATLVAVAGRGLLDERASAAREQP